MNPYDENPEQQSNGTEPAADQTAVPVPDSPDAEASAADDVPAPAEAEQPAPELTAPVPESVRGEAANREVEAIESDSPASLEEAEVPAWQLPAGISDQEELPESSSADLPEEAIEHLAVDAVESAPPAEAAESESDVADSAGQPAADAEAAAEEQPEAEQLPGYDENPLMNWFIIHTYSGFENKVAESLRTRADAFGFAERLGQILIPTEEVVEMRNGKKVTSKRMLYPGYVLIQMEMDDDLWHQVKNTPRVTGFVGGGGAPVPLSASEVNSILYRQTTAAERPRPKLTFDKNETVRIIDGPFANFSGKVDEINSERNTLRVMVTIFGRSTPVELDFLQVEKIA